MAAKGAKETIVNKLGFKSNSAKAEVEMDRLRKENAHLRRKVDEVSKRVAKPPDSDKSKLLERILSLETLRERNSQQLLVKDQEMDTLRRQLSSKGGELVASLQAQLEQRRREAEQKDKLYQSLSEETENLKNKFAALSARCQALEKQDPVALQNGHVPSGDLVVVHDQLRDALEKNQQWLVYDHQREAYVKAVLARTLELEQQLSTANTALQALQQTQHSDASTDEKSQAQARMQEHCNQLLQGAKRDAEGQREQASRAQAELGELQRRYEERSLQLEETREQLQAERLCNRHTVSEERKCSTERTDRMRVELESMDVRLEEERKRSADLLLQVNLLQKSLLSQNEEKRRMAVLEQQVQLSAKDFENEKLDRQSLQHQLQKVLKELRKARDQITRLESSKQQSRFSEPSSYNKLEFERLSIDDRAPSSPSKPSSQLDESFLECPKCRAPYATSQHRELLAHIDYCFN
ncbi:centrosomal protein of 55 kDa [Hypomesus transpacificus]|uniref:centrosomal protein of 55 kDa n=1 Tax=Hypomesus transpacificus TaxID=137520 RepID=UPI001F082C60|nr:centrosomal protein of 55 kDa [Hypomesus transpacificus]